MSSRLRAPYPELAILAAIVAAPLLPWAAGIPLALAGAALWWRAAEVARERRLGVTFFGLSTALVALAGLLEWRAAAGLSPTLARLEAGHDAWLAALAADADAVAAEMGAAGTREERRRGTFAALERRARDDRSERTYLLLDADDEAVAWSGPGLLHDLSAAGLPTAGIALRQSATSATVLAVAPVPEARGWRLVAGESHQRDGAPPVRASAVPLSTLTGGELVGGRWHLVEGASGGTDLSWSVPPRLAGSAAAERLRRVALGSVGLALFVLAAWRGAGRALLAGTVMPRRHPPAAIVLLGAAALGCGALAAGATRPAAALLAATVLAAAGGWHLGQTPRSAGGFLLAGAAAVPVLAAAAAAVAARSPSLASLGASLGGGADAVALRIALVAAAFALVAAGGAAPAARRPTRWAWLALAAAGAGVAFADRPWLALPLLAAAGVAASRAVWPQGLASVAPLAGTVLLSALVAGGGWVVGERLATARASERWTAALLPPGVPQLATEREGIERAFATLDLDALLPAGARLTESGDLAYALWRRSPLARLDALSAVTVESAGETRSVFSYGLPLDGLGRFDDSPERWVDLFDRSWPEARIGGELDLAAGDGVTRTLRWWLVPRLGFGRARQAGDELVAGLLRGGATLERPFALPADARWAVWGADGEPRGSSWEESIPERESLPSTLRPGARVTTPEGPARVTVRRTREGTAAVFLPRLGSAGALERAGTVAAGGALPLLAVALAAFAAALPRSAVRDLARRALRSYSKRLLIVYAALLLVPVALLYVLLSRTLERRIEREQEMAARAALVTVQRVMGEYVLTLDPGFDIGTALDDRLLEWLSRVVRHEVNLYWGSEIYASSKRDLFAAGLLSRRLPGAVWERLSLSGDGLAQRTTRAAGAEYLELYAPLEVPGQPTREARLVVSMPLLAQQEEALAEGALLRRRALLATLALFLLLAVTGTRLARRFTRPIEEIVRGTQRIAAGATELGMRPEEAELEALVEAIDRMAGRLAHGRESLLAEKRLVERIVESVTAGVVAVDAADQVLIANRAARELLGVAPGESLSLRLAERPELAPVAGLIAGSAGAPSRTTVRFGAGPGEEREWSVMRVPLAEAGDASALVVVEDVTEVLRAQRLEAWAAMARIIAHEIKNPLTPIRLSAEHLRDAWARDRGHFEEVFERCATNILRQVDELRGIASEFSLYSQIPRIERQEGDLVAAVREVVEAYSSPPPPGVEVIFTADPAELPLRFDRKLVPRAVRNLIENSVRASAGRGRVEIRVERQDGAAVVRVADQGPGVPPELLPRILEPYFSTHAAGTGLGLPIAAKVAEEHGGSLVARNRISGGLEVVVRIPFT